MEIKSNFNRELSTEMILQDFVFAYTHGRDIADTYSKFIKKLDEEDKQANNIERNAQRRKIIEKCRDLFKDISTKKTVDRLIDFANEKKLQSKGVPITESEITKMLVKTLPDFFWGDDKRRYNMSNLASENMINTRTTPQGKIEKDVTFFNEPQSSESDMSPISITNSATGVSISIEYLGHLRYSTFGVDNEYISKFRIKKTSNDIIRTYDVFSNIDLNLMLDDKEYSYAVITELLSMNNIEFSKAGGYIGEIHNTPSSANNLDVGQEKEDGGIYTYQITPSKALVYDGTVIEAVNAYNEQQLKDDAER